MSNTTTTKNLPNGYTAEKVATHKAYAKNGNLTNATTYYIWKVRTPAGKAIGTERTLTGATDLAAIHADMGD